MLNPGDEVMVKNFDSSGVPISDEGKATLIRLIRDARMDWYAREGWTVRFEGEYTIKVRNIRLDDKL